MGHQKSSPEREVHGFQAYFKKQEKYQINSLTLHFKELEKQQQAKPRVRRRKEIIKIMAEMYDIETKKEHKISMKSRAYSLKR